MKHIRFRLTKRVNLIAVGAVLFLIAKGVSVFAQTAVSPVETKLVPVPVPLPLEERKTGVPSLAPLEIKETAKEIKVELKDAGDLTSPLKGCKNLCGDGICQEIVCMAIGCPCPETPASCPQDCQTSKASETKASILPIIQLPETATKIEINPNAETKSPVLIEGKELKIEGIETKEMPKISVNVQTSKGVETAVQIEIDKEKKIVKIEHENAMAVSEAPVKVEEKTLKIETPKGEISVNVLPSQVTQIVIQKEPQKIEQILLKVEKETSVYEAWGTKSERFLGIIPVKLLVQTKVDAQSGKILKIQKPIWARMVDFLAF